MNLPRAALAATTLVLVAGCGASASTFSASDSSAPAIAAPGTPDVSAPEPGKVASGSLGYAPSSEGTRDSAGTTVADGTAPGPAQSAAVISTGEVSVETKDVDRARFDLGKLLARWHGSIANEKSGADEHGKTQRETLELRVPSSQFDAAMDELSKLGTLVDRSRSAEDVSTQVIDNRARVRSQRLSLARVQALLARAKSISEIIAIEAQLSDRQAELDSLVQQQAYLADQTAMATINLYLAVPEKHRTERPDDDSGFLHGLRSGWDNLGDGTGAVLTGVGAALPFAAVIGVVGLPLWFLRRRRAARA